MHTCTYNLRSQKQVLDFMGLVQAIGARNQILVLCRRVLGALNSWVISPAPQLPCFFVEFSPEKTYIGASCLSEWAGEGRGVLLQSCPLSFSSPTNATQRWPLQSLSIERGSIAGYLKFQFSTCCAFSFAESTQITPLTDNLSIQRALRWLEKKREVPCVCAKSHSEEAHIVWIHFYHKNHGYNTVPGIKLRKVYMLGNMQLMFCLCPWMF